MGECQAVQSHHHRESRLRAETASPSARRPCIPTNEPMTIHPIVANTRIRGNCFASIRDVPQRQGIRQRDGWEVTKAIGQQQTIHGGKRSRL